MVRLVVVNDIVAAEETDNTREKLTERNERCTELNVWFRRRRFGRCQFVLPALVSCGGQARLDKKEHHGHPSHHQLLKGGYVKYKCLTNVAIAGLRLK